MWRDKWEKKSLQCIQVHFRKGVGGWNCYFCTFLHCSSPLKASRVAYNIINRDRYSYPYHWGYEYEDWHHRWQGDPAPPLPPYWPVHLLVTEQPAQLSFTSSCQSRRQPSQHCPASPHSWPLNSWVGRFFILPPTGKHQLGYCRNWHDDAGNGLTHPAVTRKCTGRLRRGGGEGLDLRTCGADILRDTNTNSPSLIIKKTVATNSLNKTIQKEKGLWGGGIRKTSSLEFWLQNLTGNQFRFKGKWICCCPKRRIVALN